VGGSDPEDEPSPHSGLGGERLLGERDRMAPVERDDGSSELDPWGVGRHRDQGRQGIGSCDLRKPEARKAVFRRTPNLVADRRKTPVVAAAVPADPHLRHSAPWKDGAPKC